MKNIHVIPTEKPSRLVIDTIENKLYYKPILHNKTVNVLTQYIYITSSEQIKDGDWFYLYDADIIAKYVNVKPVGEGKKIILTTDVDLITDGVQAIDDEFLEWFVKNPKCEEVEVKKRFSDFTANPFVGYEIIITKEEPNPFELQEPPIPDSEFYKSFESKQETLEEAAEKHASLYYDKNSESSSVITESIEWSNRKHNFIKGAAWQAKRMYSEEEVLQLLLRLQQTESYDNLYDWFEQFKKQKL